MSVSFSATDPPLVRCSPSKKAFHLAYAPTWFTNFPVRTAALLIQRVHEHLGKSFLTGSTLSDPKHSNIRKHSRENNHPMRPENFKIIGRARPLDNIRLLESVYIRYINPDLNDMETAMPLHIIWLSISFHPFKFSNFVREYVVSHLVCDDLYSLSSSYRLNQCLHLRLSQGDPTLLVSLNLSHTDFPHDTYFSTIYISYNIFSNYFQTASCLNYPHNPIAASSTSPAI